MRDNFAKYGEVSLGKNVFFGKFCVIGCPKEKTIKCFLNSKVSLEKVVAPVKISDSCIIGNHVSIYEGVEIASGTLIEDHVRVGYSCKIGHNVRIMYGAYICDRVTIGDEARIGGFICDGAQIGERSTVMGNLVHEYSHPHLGWWQVDESSPIIESDVVVGFRANVIGGIRISSHTYVAAGAVVTKSVPTKHVVKGINEQIPFKNWRGRKLTDLIGYWNHE